MMDTLLTQLRLPGIRNSYKDWLDRAAREELPYADFLHGLLHEELAQREKSQLKRRTKQAALPFIRTIEQFDFTFRPELKRQVIGRYLDQSFIASATPLVFIGAPGLGKTHLAVAICAKMLQLGATVRFVTAQSLCTNVLRARDVDARQRLLKPLFNADLFVLDELGYINTDPRLGPVLYELIATRYEKKPMIITSNKALSDWGGIFQDPSLAAALIDRLIHHGDIYHFEGPSYRLKGKTPAGQVSPGTFISHIAESDETKRPGKEKIVPSQ